MTKTLNLRDKRLKKKSGNEDNSIKQSVKSAQKDEEKTRSRKSSEAMDTAIGAPRFVPPIEEISWTGPLYYTLGSKRVALIASIVMFGLAVLFYLVYHSAITAILMALLGVLILVRSNKPAPMAEFEVSPVHVRVNDDEYHIDDIESFWIDYIPELDVHELSLQLKKWHKFYVKIPLQAVDPVQVREILIDFVPEKKHEETLGDALTRRMGL